MTFKEFEKQAKKIGHMKKCEVSIFGKYIKDAMLTKQSSPGDLFVNQWFILQNYHDGIIANNTYKYKYSCIVSNDYTSSRIDFIRPKKLNNRGKNLRGSDGRFRRKTSALPHYLICSRRFYQEYHKYLENSNKKTETAIAERVTDIEQKLYKIVKILESKS